MDHYDGVELFGSELGNLYYSSNDLDPYMKDNNDDDSEEEEDITIKPEDIVIAFTRTCHNLERVHTGSYLEVKLWDLANNKPLCVASRNPKAGEVFLVSFSEDAPFSPAIGGSKSNGELKVWHLLSDARVAGRYGKYANVLRCPQVGKAIK